MADPRLSILQHALGVDQYGRGEQYREHFVAGPGHSDYRTCMAMAAEGLMQRHVRHGLDGGSDLFVVTDAGRRFVRENSPRPPKLTRSQRRYEAWLRADCGMTFREWLRCSPEVRRG